MSVTPPSPEDPAQQPFGQPLPGRHPPAAYARAGIRPPGPVIGAAVIALIVAALTLLGGVGALVIALTGNEGETQRQFWGSTSVGVAVLFGISKLVWGGLLVWGSVTALRGTTNRVLVVTLAALILYNLGWIVLNAVSGAPGFVSLVAVTFQCVAFWLIRVRQSKEFFCARAERQSNGD